MKKMFLMVLCVVTLSGCFGSSTSNTENTNSVDPLKKTIANKYATITVPEGWNVLKTPSSTPQLILMERFPMTANLINGEDFDSDTSKKLFELAQNEFPTATLLEELTNKTLKFSAKKNNDSDEYIFEQKIITMDDDEFLLANCSYPYDYPDNECADFFDAIKLR